VSAAGAALVAVALPSTVLGSSSSRASADSCTVAELDGAAGLAAGAGFSGVQCAGGWALAVGSRGPGGGAALFREKQGRWVEVKGLASGEDVSWLASAPVATPISPVLLQRLARPFGASVREAAAAAVLVAELAAREARLRARGAYQVSPVLSVAGRVWLALEGADAAISSNYSWTASPYPDGTVSIYRWTAGGWTEQAQVRGSFGPIGGCCGIAAVSLTGSRDPDLALQGGGAADTNWLTVVSDVGGRWHAVPFDYGYTDTTVVNGTPGRHGVFTEVDASSAAGGPTTLLFETYQGGVFRPASPPGRSAPCSVSDLQFAAGDGQLAVFEFSRFACADGWAMAIGTGAGYTNQVVGLFEADGTHWRTIALDNGDSLGSDPGIYDIPLSLLRRLAAGFGPGVAPDLATAPLIAQPAMTGWLYVNGVMTADGSEWYVKETPTGSVESPGANAEIYRWSGSAWVEQGRVDGVPASLNYFRALSGGWFEPVAVPGARDPGFTMQGAGSSSSEVLTDAGGAWHVRASATTRKV